MRYSPQLCLLPLLEHSRADVPHVIAVVDRTGADVRAVNARAVLVAGEVQARTGLLAELPEPASRVAVELTAGSRAAGSDHEALRARVLDRITTDDREELFDSYRGNRGVQGLPAVTAALRDGNAEAVMVNPSLLRDRIVWATAGEPTWLATSKQELLELGLGGDGDGAAERPADEAIPVAAVAVGAELLVTAELEPTDGTGAVLRHT